MSHLHMFMNILFVMYRIAIRNLRPCSGYTPATAVSYSRRRKTLHLDSWGENTKHKNKPGSKETAINSLLRLGTI